MESVRLALPWPPSANRYWRNITVRGRARTLLSREAREFRDDVVEIAILSGAGASWLTGSIGVDIVAYPPDRRVRDVDNLLKPTLDALKFAGVIEDDRFVDDLRIRRGPSVPGGLLVVTLHLITKAMEDRCETVSPTTC